MEAVDHVETSALDSSNVDTAFMQIVSQIHEQIIKNSKMQASTSNANPPEALSNSILASLSSRKAGGHSHIGQGVRLEK